MLHITARVQQMLHYAVMNQPNLEVGGYGKLEIVGEGDKQEFWFTDILIPPQEVAGAALDFGQEGVAWAMLQLADRGETLSDWNIWWHSHSTLAPSHSNQDTTTLEQFAEMVSSGWAIGVVTNTKREWDCWLHVTTGPWPLTQNKVELALEPFPPNKELNDEVDEMMKVVSKANSSPALVYSGNRYDEWYYGLNDDDIDDETGDEATYLARDGKYYNWENLTIVEQKNWTDADSRMVWCKTHDRFDTECRCNVIPSHNCRHDQNCGGYNCDPKDVRKKRKEAYDKRQKEQPDFSNRKPFQYELDRIDRIRPNRASISRWLNDPPHMERSYNTDHRLTNAQTHLTTPKSCIACGTMGQTGYTSKADNLLCHPCSAVLRQFPDRVLTDKKDQIQERAS